MCGFTWSLTSLAACLRWEVQTMHPPVLLTWSRGDPGASNAGRQPAAGQEGVKGAMATSPPLNPQSQVMVTSQPK